MVYLASYRKCKTINAQYGKHTFAANASPRLSSSSLVIECQDRRTVVAVPVLSSPTFPASLPAAVCMAHRL
jgi:hypothetical protein